MPDSNLKSIFFDIYYLQISADTLQLFANDNRITNITVADEAKLTHLYVTHNQITEISSITKLMALQYLDLSGNSIGRLSLDKFAALNALTKLGLHISTWIFSSL
jgi:Leucine-rich repeat (LRR) protein